MLSEFKKNKKRGFWKNVFFLILLGAGTLLVIIFLFFTNWKINQKRAELIPRIEALKKEIQILEKKNQELQAGISQSKTPEKLEEIAREKLGYFQPGEEVMVIKKEAEEEKKVEEEKKSWWDWLKSIWSR